MAPKSSPETTDLPDLLTSTQLISALDELAGHTPTTSSVNGLVHETYDTSRGNEELLHSNENMYIGGLDDFARRHFNCEDLKLGSIDL
jgi:hypothetical protein